MWLNVSVVCFLASYVTALLLELWRVYGRAAAPRPALTRWGVIAATGAGFLAHTLFLTSRGQQTQLPPLLSSPNDWFLVLAWVLMVVHLSVALLDSRLASGLVMLPLVLALVVGSQLTGSTTKTPLDATRGWALLHASLLVFGIAAVSLAFASGLLYLWQHHRLKERVSFQQGVVLPSLARLEWLNRWCVIASVPFLTLGVASGFLLTRLNPAAESFPTFTDPVVIAGAVIWIVMTLILARLLTGQRPAGRQVAWLTVMAGGFLLASLLGLQALVSATGVQSVHGAPQTGASAEPASPSEPTTITATPTTVPAPTTPDSTTRAANTPAPAPDSDSNLDADPNPGPATGAPPAGTGE